MAEALVSTPTPSARLAFCRPCNRRDAVIDDSGRCLVCGQFPDQPVAGECTLCSGEGVVDGLLVGSGPSLAQRCAACHGLGHYGTAGAVLA